MFKAQHVGTLIGDAPASVVALYQSSNTRELALGRGGTRPTRAFIVATAPAEDTYRLYVFFRAVDDPGDPGMLFRAEPEPVRADDYGATLQEATDMVGTQGFVMSEIALAELSGPQRLAYMAHLPFPADLTSMPPTTAAGFMAGVTGPLAVGGRLATPAPPIGAEAFAPLHAGVGAEPTATSYEISREITLPSAELVRRLGRLLSLF